MSIQGGAQALALMEVHPGVCPACPSLPAHEVRAKVGGHLVGHSRLALSVPLLSLFAPQLDIVEFIPSLLYFGYTALMVLSFWLLTGTIGFYAAYMFVRKIYAAVKID